MKLVQGQSCALPCRANETQQRQCQMIAAVSRRYYYSLPPFIVVLGLACCLEIQDCVEKLKLILSKIIEFDTPQESSNQFNHDT